MAEQTGTDQPWFLKAQCPVYLPRLEALTLGQDDFEAYVREIIKSQSSEAENESTTGGLMELAETDMSESFALLDPSTTGDVREAMDLIDVGNDGGDEEIGESAGDSTGAQASHLFIEGLTSFQVNKKENPSMENKMLTENADIAHQSTRQALVDLFSELEEVISSPRLLELLNAGWAKDPLATLKIIMNTRSIHLGKASRTAFYRCAGWLAQYYPLTLAANLQWLSRPVIPKKLAKEGEDDMVIVDAEKPAADTSRFDVRNGVAHGYWKDLLNIVALSVSGNLNVLANPRDILNTVREAKPQHSTAEEAREKRHDLRDNRHAAAVDALKRPVHQVLHITVSRLFAEQLKLDLAILWNKDPKAKDRISLCAKWAPSTDRFHDKHTFIVSSIAELMYPEEHFANLNITLPSTQDHEADRAVYLRYAREAYRKDVAALRAQLDIVERNITAKTYDKIKYPRVPSVAMNNYTSLFAEKDTERFSAYLDKVAEGKVQISGATLLPSTLIKAVRTRTASASHRQGKAALAEHRKALEERMAEIQLKSVDGQWNSLVQRIKDSGTMEACMAVCDVSGSMMEPVFNDGTCPLDSSIGLSLLVAEVTKPPFGGAFITFSSTPEVNKISLGKPLRDKFNQLRHANWGMSTDFVSVFRDLILPMAVENKVSREDMVKRIFVFSDMQFDSADDRNSRWSTSYERIQKDYQAAGYEMPELVFWNLAGGRGGYQSDAWGNPIAPKPVTAEDKGTALISGYSQGMLKVFMDKGIFEEEEDEEEEDAVEATEEGDEVMVQTKKRKIDPLAVVNKAIGHSAYSMLVVAD